MAEPALRRVTFTRRDDGRWTVVRERDETGETFHAVDLIEAFAIVTAAYLADGSPRPWPAHEAGRVER